MSCSCIKPSIVTKAIALAGGEQTLPSNCPPDIMRDALSRTRLCEKDINSLYIRYRKSAPNGKLLFAKFQDTMGMLGVLDDPFLSERMFDAFDTVKDGVLRPLEFIVGIGTMIRGDDDERLELSFRILNPKCCKGTEVKGSTDDYINLAEFRFLIRSLELTRYQLSGSNLRIADDWEIEDVFHDIATVYAENQLWISSRNFKDAVRNNSDFLRLIGAVPLANGTIILSQNNGKTARYRASCATARPTRSFGPQRSFLDTVDRERIVQSDSLTEDAGLTKSGKAEFEVYPERSITTPNVFIRVSSTGSKDSTYNNSIITDQSELIPRHCHHCKGKSHIYESHNSVYTHIRDQLQIVSCCLECVIAKILKPMDELGAAKMTRGRLLMCLSDDNRDDGDLTSLKKKTCIGVHPTTTPKAGSPVSAVDELIESGKDELSKCIDDGSESSSYIPAIFGLKQSTCRITATAGVYLIPDNSVDESEANSSLIAEAISKLRLILDYLVKLSLTNVGSPAASVTNTDDASCDELQDETRNHVTFDTNITFRGLNESKSDDSNHDHLPYPSTPSLSKTASLPKPSSLPMRVSTTASGLAPVARPNAPQQISVVPGLTLSKVKNRLTSPINDDDDDALKSIQRFRTDMAITSRMYMNRPNFEHQRMTRRHPHIVQTAISRRRPEKKILNSQKGLAVHFGHESWNMVLNMMVGIRLACGRISNEPRRKVERFDFVVREKFSILPRVSNFYDSAKGQCVKYEFVKFMDYAPVVFRKSRELFGVTTEDYLKSIGPDQLVGNMVLGNLSSLAELCSEGKSGAFFYFTADGRFLIKTLTREHAIFFRRILSDYYNHISNNRETLLTRFFGFHAIKLRREGKTAVSQKLYFVVMANVLNTPVELHRRYDLKGSTFGRSSNISEASDPSVALKDLDLLTNEEFINIGDPRRSRLLNVLQSDAHFLRSLNILDYSLLVGIHKIDPLDGSFDIQTRPESIDACSGEIQPPLQPLFSSAFNFNEQSAPLENLSYIRPFYLRDQGGMQSTNSDTIFFLGVIDIFTEWTTLKKMEHAAKKVMIGQAGISCVKPIVYADRFMTFMRRVIN